MKDTIHEEWLDKARQDLETCQILLENSGPAAVVCFHAHQAAEKVFKALLIRYRIKPPRTHDLARLCRMCMNLESSFSALLDDCRWLAQFYIETRYPVSGDNQFETQTARRTVAVAQMIASQVKAKLR